MFVIVNGQTYPMPEIRTLAALLTQLSPALPFAVARNAEVIPHGSYEQCRILPGDRIDIVHPTAGG
jgi:thiamine biosynthesis protein ThiS